MEGRDFDVENLTRVWRKTNEQDATYVGWTQTGIRTEGYDPGLFTPNENQLEKFLSWYVEWLGVHLGVSARPHAHAQMNEQGSAAGRTLSA